MPENALKGIIPASASGRFALSVYCTIETIWGIYYATTKNRLGKHNDNPPSLEESCGKSMLEANDGHSIRMRFFLRCRRDVKSVEKFTSKWFLGFPRYYSLRVGDIREWLSWAFFSTVPENLAEDEKDDLENMIETFQHGTLEPLKEGRSGARCIKLTLDELRSQVRPFIFYVATMAVDFYAFTNLSLFKFTRHYSSNGKFTYWTSPAIGGTYAKSEDPIFFVHGIGIVQLADEVPTMLETFKAVDDIYKKLRIKKAVWIGHSLGTVVCSWMCKRRPDLISQVIFIDPIVFALFEPDVAFNFLYRNPGNGFQLLMWFLASQELYIAHSLRRHFWWYQAILFPEDLPETTVPARVFLSECDQIISCSRVLSHLKEYKVWVKEWKNFRHGQFAVKLEAQLEVFDVLGR
ncbi:hypothetical protein HDU67_004066 [Dinochytrium kinnereticum]|nr:hypothetical protein HDU67_004066 [Dinochytrium kinnereticum]